MCVIFLRFCAIAFWWCYPAFSVALYLLFDCSVWVAWLFRFFLPGPSNLYIDGPGKATCWSCVSFVLLVCFEVHMHWLGQHGIRRTGTIRRSAESAEAHFHLFYMKDLLAWRGGVVQLYFQILCYIFIESRSLTSWRRYCLFIYPHSWDTGSNVLCLGWSFSLRVSYVHQGFVLEFDWYLMCLCFSMNSILLWYLIPSSAVHQMQHRSPTWHCSVPPARRRPALRSYFR